MNFCFTLSQKNPYCWLSYFNNYNKIDYFNPLCLKLNLKTIENLQLSEYSKQTTEIWCSNQITPILEEFSWLAFHFFQTCCFPIVLSRCFKYHLPSYPTSTIIAKECKSYRSKYTLPIFSDIFDQIFLNVKNKLKSIDFKLENATEITRNKWLAFKPHISLAISSKEQYFGEAHSNKYIINIYFKY